MPRILSPGTPALLRAGSSVRFPYYFNFQTGVYLGAGLSDFQCTRAASGATDLTPFDPPGQAYSNYFSGTPRIRSGLGWIIEAGAKVNSYPSGEAPANQTTATLSAGTYTAQVNAEAGGSLALSAGTPANVSGLATVTHGNPVTFVVSGAGSTISGVCTGTIHFIQIENTGWATSFIKGGGTRGNELCQLGFLPAGMSTGRGTLVAAMTHFPPFGINTAPEVLVNLDDSTASNNSRVSLFRRFNTPNNVARAVIDTQADIGPLSDVWLSNTRGALGIAVDQGYQAECFNGGAVSLATGNLPSNGVTTMRFGKGSSNATGDHAYGVLHLAMWTPAVLGPADLQRAVRAAM